MKALALGRVAVIGDHIRINARLISTATGQTASAAAVSIARNGEIDGLLQQQIGSNNGICGSVPSGSTTENAADSVASAPTSDSGGVPSTRSATHEGVTFTIQNVSRSPDKKTVSVVLAVVDKLKNSVLAVMTQPKPTLLDDQANLADINILNGIPVCQDINSFADGSYCANAFPRSRWTTLSSNMPTMLLMRFIGQQPIQGSHVSIAASVLLSPVGDDGQVKPADAKLVSLSFANVPISSQTATR